MTTRLLGSLRAGARATSNLKRALFTLPFTVNGGDAFPVVNARTIPGAIKRILKLMAEKVVKGQPLHVAVMHADAMDKATLLRDCISSQFNCAELFITEFTPVMGVHTGPGVIGVAFYSGD